MYDGVDGARIESLVAARQIMGFCSLGTNCGALDPSIIRKSGSFITSSVQLPHFHCHSEAVRALSGFA